MRIPEMCLELSFCHSKWGLQVILSVTVLSKCVLAVQTLTPLFSPTVLNFVLFF